MTSESRAHRNPLWLVLASCSFGLALWSSADGEPFWWHVAFQVGMGLYFVGAFAFPASETFDIVVGLVGGLFLVLAPGAMWLRVVGALMVVVGLFLMVRAIARSRPTRSSA